MAILEERTLWEICRIDKEAFELTHDINWKCGRALKVVPTIEKIKKLLKSIEEVDSKKLLEAPLYPDAGEEGITSIEGVIIDALYQFKVLIMACTYSGRPKLVEIGKKLNKPIAEFWDRCERNVFVRAVESRC